MINKGRIVCIAVAAIVVVSCIFWSNKLLASGASLFDPINPFSKFNCDIGGLPIQNMTKKIDKSVLSSKSVAVLHIEGVIEDENATYNHKWLCDTIDTLTDSSLNQGILLFISSPGGGVYQADEVYEKIRDYKAKTQRPVWAYLGPMAASGGYYIACAADAIYANRNTLTGSIGVICGQSVDMTGLFEKLGIKVQTIHSGRNKTMFNPDTPLTLEQQKIMQTISDECYDQFVTIVSDSRKMSNDTIRTLADGRIYTARQAKTNGLIDDIARLEDVKTLMKDKCSLSSNIPFEDLQYEYKMTLESFFSSVRTLFSAPSATVPDFVTQRIADFHFYPAYYAPGLER